MRPPHPGEFILRNYIEALGVTRNELAEALGVHRTTLSKLLNERAAISADMAVRLSRGKARQEGKGSRLSGLALQHLRAPEIKKGAT
jgi:addiction module HigA family antidote